jgi:hypothetical protein
LSCRSEASKQSGSGGRAASGIKRGIPKSARTETDILKQCGLHHADITRKAASMLGIVNV